MTPAEHGRTRDPDALPWDFSDLPVRGLEKATREARVSPVMAVRGTAAKRVVRFWGAFRQPEGGQMRHNDYKVIRDTRVWRR